MEKVIKNAKKLMKDLETKKHPEYGATKIKGVSLSRSDVDILEMILETMIQTGEYPFSFMPTYGEKQTVLEAYGLPTQKPNYGRVF